MHTTKVHTGYNTCKSRGVLGPIQPLLLALVGRWPNGSSCRISSFACKAWTMSAVALGVRHNFSLQRDQMTTLPQSKQGARMMELGNKSERGKAPGVIAIAADEKLQLAEETVSVRFIPHNHPHCVRSVHECGIRRVMRRAPAAHALHE